MLQVDDSMRLAPWGPMECTEELDFLMKWVEVAEYAWTGDDGDSFVILYPGWYNVQEDGGGKEGVKH